ncbi:BlaI/MecI/CopY family transcriptional regulator [Granulicella mallensis]|uniref:Transcriptional repressor, CopY family n=1 Tax=Granulicella mallensis (strain ATCC BAA-1857 / DSM 23137 / MP5ACTX8) TaxID=682795 RepID=G8NXU3_GRAMM|nr:BlaI/MecI/CopY family transcriptional regulator [Granulicella mallensis]AEU34438.1 transcriptional repressor, CopY family [Granulicella mallensis MP5ACTX8]
MVGRKKGSTALTPLELQIMQVLWAEGPSNVLQVQKSLSPKNDLAYNTVQTMLNVLHRKGRVKRTLMGRAYVYRTVASREAVLGQAVRDLVERMFGGSSEDLVMSLVKNRQVDLERIADLGRKMAQEKGEHDE